MINGNKNEYSKDLDKKIKRILDHYRGAFKMKNKKDKKNLLYKLCKHFVKTNNILCGESIYQTDNVQQNSLELVENICKIVGFSKELEEKE